MAPSAKKAPKTTPMEDFLGPNLLTAVDATPKPTMEVLRGKDLVAVYFSAAWCPPCSSFTPKLIDFYNTVGKDGGLEIVYISSDHDVAEFNQYFGKMPWVAQPVDKESALIKNKMAEALKVAGIPALIVLDAKTGNFITDLARIDVTNAHKNKEKGLAILAEWKAKEAFPIAEATLTGGQGPMTMRDFIYSILKNPMFIFALAYLGKKLFKMLAEYGKDGDETQSGSEL